MKFLFNSQKRMIVYLLSVFMIFGIFSGCRTSTAKEEKPLEKTKVVVKPATGISEKATILVSGFLEADKTVLLGFLVPGKVETVHVDEGDHVVKGQVLANVEIDDYRSHLEIAQAKLLRAQDAYDRLKPLYKDGAITEQDFIEVKTGLAQAKAGRNIARKKVKDTILRSPVSGIVGMKTVEIGRMISPGMPVFTIVKTDKIYAKVSVPESEIGKIALGQETIVNIPALENREVTGRVSLIGAMADPRTRTYTVKAELANPDYTLRTGMIAEAKIVTDRQIDIITVPGKAIVRDAQNLTYVFLADQESGRALRRRVFPGMVHNNQIEIKSGLTTGDNVIVAGQHKLTDGASIALVDSDMRLAK